MAEGESSTRWTLRRVALVFYIVFLELVGIGCLSLAIYTITSVRVRKLRIWEQFGDVVPNLPPILAAIAAAATIAAPIPVLVGVVKKNQFVIMIFCGVVTVAALTWFGIGAWCVSMQSLILNDIPLIFERMKTDASRFDFLKDLQENMPRFNNRWDFECCASTPEKALPQCAPACGTSYQELFKILIFPSLYAIFFGAGVICLLSLVCACLVSCYLDDVKPAL